MMVKSCDSLKDVEALFALFFRQTVPGVPVVIEVTPTGPCTYNVKVLVPPGPDGTKAGLALLKAIEDCIIRPPIPEVVVNPVEEASGWGDPHFKGFDGSKFHYHGAPGTWKDLFGSSSPRFNIRTQFAGGTRIPGTTFMRAFDFRAGGGATATKVDIRLLPPLRGATIWRLTATLNGRPVVGTASAGGFSVTVVPARFGTYGRVVISGKSVRLVAIQKWRPKRLEVADFLDFVVEIKGRLRDPVTGLLAPSYRKAVGSKKAGGVLTSGSETGVV